MLFRGPVCGGNSVPGSGKGPWRVWWALENLNKQCFGHENIWVSFVTSYLALCETFIFFNQTFHGCFYKLQSLFLTTLSESLWMCCVPEYGRATFLKPSEIHQSFLFEGLVGPTAQFNCASWDYFHLSLSLCLFSSMANIYGKFQPNYCDLCKMSNFCPSGKILGSVCRIWRGFFWREMWQKNRWRTGNHLHKKIICQLQRQRSTMREISRPPFHVSLMSQYLTDNLMFYLYVRREREKSNNTGL